MEACPQCPNRRHAEALESQAATLERLAGAASTPDTAAFAAFAEPLRERARELKEEAEKVRSEGCQWVWNVWMEADKEGDPPRPAMVCGASHLPKALDKAGGEFTLASKIIQADRKEQAAALKVVDLAIEELGGDEAMKALAKTGLRAYVGYRVNGSAGEAPARPQPEWEWSPDRFEGKSRPEDDSEAAEETPRD